jgi:hypothetical protein
MGSRAASLGEHAQAFLACGCLLAPLLGFCLRRAKQSSPKIRVSLQQAPLRQAELRTNFRVAKLNVVKLRFSMRSPSGLRMLASPAGKRRLAERDEVKLRFAQACPFYHLLAERSNPQDETLPRRVGGGGSEWPPPGGASLSETTRRAKLRKLNFWYHGVMVLAY